VCNVRSNILLLFILYLYLIIIAIYIYILLCAYMFVNVKILKSLNIKTRNEANEILQCKILLG